MLQRIFLFVLMGIYLVGCGTANNLEQNSTPTAAIESNFSGIDTAYPSSAISSPQMTAYPAPDQSEQPGGILLALNDPIHINDTSISGVGPVGLVVYVLDITFMGEQLGSTIVGDDGTFTIETNPLPANIRIGLTADVTEIGLTPVDIKPGNGEISIPRVGYFYDSVVINE
jgi:hypothetical protein